MAHSASEVKWGTLATDARHGSASVQVEAASHLARAVSSDSPAALAGAECCLGKVDLVQLAAAPAGGESPQFPPLSAADTLPLAGLAGYLLGCQRSDVQVAGLELALHCARAVGAAGSARGMAAASRLLHSGLCWQGPVVLLACLEQCCAAGDAAPPALASLHSAALQRALADKRCSSASSTARSICCIPVPVPGMLLQALQTVQGVLQGMVSDAARLEALRAWGVPVAEGEDVWESVAVRLAHLNLGSSLALPAGPLDAPQGVQLQSKVRAAAYAWLQEAEAQSGAAWQRVMHSGLLRKSLRTAGDGVSECSSAWPSAWLTFTTGSAHRIIPGDTLPAWAVVRESPLDVEALTWAIQRTWRHIKRHAWSALLAGCPGAPHTTPPAHPLTCTVPLPEAFGRSAEEAHAAELADALRRRRAFLEARAASQAQSGQLSMQERVDIAEVLARSASGQASAALARLRSLDEATLRGFAHGYVGVVRECLDEFLAGYADAKHAQVREWMAGHPAEVASFRQRQAAQGVVIEQGEGLPPASAPSGARGPTLRIGGTALDMSSSAVQARLGTGQTAASAGLGRAAAAMQALGQGLDAVAARHGGSAAAQAAQALQGAAGSLAGWGQRLGQGDARHVAERAEQTVAALQGASEAVWGDGGAQFAQQAHAATSPLRQAASARAAAAYAALRTSVVAGNPAALQAAASSAGQEVAQAGQAAVGAARRSSLGRSAVQFVREAAGAWGQSDHAEPARPVGLHGWEGGPDGAAGQRGGQYDPVEWALDAMGTTNAAVREAVRERLAKEGKGDGVPSTPPPPDKA